MTHSTTPSRRRLQILLSTAAAISLTAIALTGCSSSTPSSAPVTLTMWARSGGPDVQATAMVKAYNASHKDQIKLTIVPFDSYQQKVGASAGSNSLPDILTSDVVLSPNYTKQGLFVDITSRVKALPFAKDLVQAHVKAASRDGKMYGVPNNVDTSLIVYNKDLFSKAGLDPNKGPKSFDDMYNDAKAIRALGGDTYGFYFGGNCPGCNAYTMFPYANAAGTPPFSDGGKKADFDSKAFAQTFALYKKMFDEGIAPSSAKTEDGTTWTTQFLAGKIGIIPAGSFLTSQIKKGTFDWGTVPLMAPDGSASSGFVGGDMVGISRNSKHVDAAWNYIKWSLGENAQVNIVAKMGGLPDRVDLANNKYSSADPRISAIVKSLANGYTPSALPYGELINANNGAWSTEFRDAIFGSDPAAALATAQKTIQAGVDASH